MKTLSCQAFDTVTLGNDTQTHNYLNVMPSAVMLHVVMLSVFVLHVVMLSVFVLHVVMLSVFVQNVVMLNVVAP